MARHAGPRFSDCEVEDSLRLLIVWVVVWWDTLKIEWRTERTEDPVCHIRLPQTLAACLLPQGVILPLCFPYIDTGG